MMPESVEILSPVQSKRARATPALDILCPRGDKGDRDGLSAVADDVDFRGSGWMRGPSGHIHLGDDTINFIRLL